MMAAHTATCPLGVCVLQTTFCLRNTPDSRLLWTPAVVLGLQMLQGILQHVMLCQSKNRGSLGCGTVL